jgi:hypothetical protein
MRTSLLMRLGALVAVPALVPALVVVSTAPASAQEAEEIDYAVTASFDKAEYGSGDDFDVTITVSNPGTVAIDHVYVYALSPDLDFGEQTWGDLAEPGASLAPGAAVTATATARLFNVVDSVRLEVNVVVVGDQWDPDDEGVDAVLEAPVHQTRGILGGVVYGDRNGNGAADAGEELRGVKVSFSGGVPWRDYEARTGSDGRYRIDLPTGVYTAYGLDIDGWSLEEMPGIRVREGEQVLDFGARRMGRTVIRAAMSFDRNRYSVGDPIRVHITLTNPSPADVSGVVAWCARAGSPQELPSEGWGELQYGGPGVVVPSNSTREFDITHTVPAGARDRGYVSASCGFIVGEDVYNSAEVSAVADVPGDFTDYSGRVLEVRAAGAKVPAAHVRLMLVHRTGRIVARTRSDARGRYTFRHAPNNEYRMRVAGPWKLVDPDHAYYVGSIVAYPPEDVLIVRGPAEPGAAGRDTPDPQRPTAEPAAPTTLASTGADIGTPFLAGLLLLTTGTVLLLARPRRTRMTRTEQLMRRRWDAGLRQAGRRTFMTTPGSPVLADHPRTVKCQGRSR